MAGSKYVVDLRGASFGLLVSVFKEDVKNSILLNMSLMKDGGNRLETLPVYWNSRVWPGVFLFLSRMLNNRIIY